MINQQSLTACLWSPLNENHLYCGDLMGGIFCIDVRQPYSSYENIKIPGSIHRLREVDENIAALNLTSTLYLIRPHNFEIRPDSKIPKNCKIRDVCVKDGVIYSIGTNSASFFAH